MNTIPLRTLPASALVLSALLFATVFATAVPLDAQRRGSVATNVARAADSDRSGDVSAAEWAAFVESVPADAKNGIDRKRFMARIMLPTLDRTSDGVVKTADLDRLFSSRDRNRNADLEADEIGRRGVFMDRIVLANADSDGDGTIKNAEWSAFLKNAKAADGITVATAQAWIAKGTAPSDADRTAMTPGVILLTMVKGLDPNNDGVVKADDLQAIFKGLDSNADGSLQATELTARRIGNRGAAGAGRNAAGGFGRGGRVSAADRSKPGLVPWQRNLDDALALVKRTGKPLLICVNMDGESACEQFAWRYYRDEAFAKLTKGFIPILASPDRRTPVDHDDRGRRLVEPRFGRVVNAEHIDHEPVLFAKYFSGQRVAPRHVGVDKNGKILFDIYLTNDLASVGRALAKHGVPAGSAESEDRSIGGLLRSYDAGDRARLEQMFLAADVATRTSLAGKSLSSARKTQHPELLRLALCDPDAGVRAQAVQTVSENLDRTPTALVQRALLEAFGDIAAVDALINALHRQSVDTSSAGTPEQKKAAAALARIYSGLQTSSRLVDAKSWRRQLAGASAVVEAPPAASEIDAINARLDELEKLVRAKPTHRGLRLTQASTTLRAVRIQIAQGRDPTFLLQDVRGSAAKATSPSQPNSLALAHVAVACHLLDEPDTLDQAARALQALAREPERAATAIAAEVLDLFALRRTRDVYNAMTTGTSYPLSWVSDIRAAYEVLLDHPAGTEKQATAFVSFAGGIGVPGLQAAALERAVTRFWHSSDLHSRYRGFGLTQRGSMALENDYAKFVKTQGGRATKLWYAGLGSLMAAERHVTNRLPQDAGSSYARSIEYFSQSLRQDPNFADSANHYVCLAHAGAAQLQLQSGDVASAAASIRSAMAARPGTMSTANGLGVTPTKTAGDVLRALETKGLDEKAKELRDAMAKAGLSN